MFNVPYGKENTDRPKDRTKYHRPWRENRGDVSGGEGGRSGVVLPYR